MSISTRRALRGRDAAARLLTLTAVILFPTALLQAQSVKPAIFVAHNIETNLQFGNIAAITTFTMNPDGSVDLVGHYYTNDNPQALSLSPNGRYLAVTHGTASATVEDLLIFRVESDASLTMRAVYSTPNSPLDVEWINDEAVACTETRDGGVNNVHVYRFVDSNPIYTRLTLIDTEFTGVFTAYLQRHPTGNFLYASDSALNGSSLKVRAFSVNPDSTLEFLGDANTGSYPLDLAITHDGTKLYSAGGIGLLSGGNSHLVHGFTIDPTFGFPFTMGGSPFFSPGDSPAHLAVTGDDRILLVGHGGNGDVHSFFISPEDGFLTETFFSVSIGGQGDIGAIAAMGDYFFATRRYSSAGAPSGLLVFRILEDGAFLPIGDVISTEGPASDAITVWQPAPTSQGDINNDGMIDQLDLEAFIAVLLGMPLDSTHVERSDLNHDGIANGADLSFFVSYYLNPQLPGACCRFDDTCTIKTEVDCLAGGNATWLGAGTDCANCPEPPPVVTDAFPNVGVLCNSPGSQVFFTITGQNFAPGAGVQLTMTGQPALLPFFLDVSSQDTILAGFVIENAAPGLWQLVVSNPDGQSGTAPQPFLIEVCP